MSEKDVVYALELLHTVQIKRESIGFASFIDKKFNKLSKTDKEKLWQEYLDK
tara:strand:- start:763 stop:918 length:156 start_codon:yes stop_codon:yes gene_type:complete